VTDVEELSDGTKSFKSKKLTIKHLAEFIEQNISVDPGIYDKIDEMVSSITILNELVDNKADVSDFISLSYEVSSKADLSDLEDKADLSDIETL